MTTDTYITRLEDVVKHPEMMPDLSSIRGDIACLLAKCRELEKHISMSSPCDHDYVMHMVWSEHSAVGKPGITKCKKCGKIGNLEDAMVKQYQKLSEEHTYECAKRE